eukprot:TRINITY_DN1430_c0_g1_i5.p1 TRINITY_DN1430_c0_g1~~TRINITY_DN1430_c0_g1_i5.p1  ORF type:complete len:260 (+),score=42.77 TRINITY_DN1430_c0_g1_i5:296-1075(+)
MWKQILSVGRNEQSGAEVVAEMKSYASEDVPFNFVRCDVQELENIRELATKFYEQQNKLDFLVLTQGIATIQGRTETSEGLDQKLSLHFYSRMAFIKLFARALNLSDSPRVLSVLSGGVHSPYDGYRTDPELKENYSLQNAANAAGFYNDLVLDGFSAQQPSIAFIHSAPGFVNTNWGTELPLLLRGVVRILQPLGKTAQDCAEFMCEALFDPDLQPGFYLRGECGQVVPKTKGHTDEAKEFMWNHTAEVLDRLLSENE